MPVSRKDAKYAKKNLSIPFARLAPLREMSRPVRFFHSFLALGLWMAAAAADDADKVRAVLLEMSQALQDSSASRFLDQVDRRRCPGYAALQDNIVALAAQYEIASSVAVVEQTKDGKAWESKLDWLLEMKPAGGGGPAQRRRGAVLCRIEPSGKRWKVTRLEPVDFFKPS